MDLIPFNDDWTCNGKSVTLPYDAMIHESRSADNTAGLGYYPGGSYRYEKRWIPDGAAEQILEFEGVYGKTTVLINGNVAVTNLYGYTGFFVDLKPYLLPGVENHIEVLADNSDQPNSRWYSGSGIYRNVNLWTGAEGSIRPESVSITTLSDRPAVIRIQSPQTVSVTVEEVSGEGTDFELTIPNARLWSAEDPQLYTAIISNDTDTCKMRFGIRKLAWSAKTGLTVNGKTVKLRGACIHHDNGVIGACEFSDAAERRVRILKEAGFNAIRSAHNPCSKALLDACDRQGMYVMDEAFDTWILPKNSRDYAKDFRQNYRFDLTGMIRKDISHPSVILYSLGNETPESATSEGVQIMADMRKLILAIDDTRPLTCGISITQNIDWQSGKRTKEKFMGGVEKEEKPADPTAQIRPWMLPAVNRAMRNIMNKMDAPLETDVAENAIREACGQLDIAGYNYGERKMAYDDIHNPERIVVSSETHHPEILENWERIMKNSRLVGDFMWVGWDYIGEAGVGALGYPSRGSIGFDKPYPHLTSASGIIDITGFIRPEVYWTQMAWGMRTEPVIAVEPLEFAGENYMMTYWNDTEAVSSWTWPGYEGRKATVKVYTPAEKVELYFNGRRVATKKVSRNMAVFHVTYRPGCLKAIAYDRDGSTKETRLTTASGKKMLLLQSEESSLRPGGLGYIHIAIADESGIVYAAPEQEIRVAVEGAGELQGLGSGAICTEDSFVSGICHTFHGRALAVIRAGENGKIRITVTSGTLRETLQLDVSTTDSDSDDMI